MLDYFRPKAPTQLIAATTTTQAVALLATGTCVRIANTSGHRARFAFGKDANVVAVTPTGAAQATAGSLGLADATTEDFLLNDPGDSYVAVVLDGGTGNVEVTVGTYQP